MFGYWDFQNLMVINIIAVVTARPIINPVLELSLVDDVDAKNRQI